MPSNQRKGNVVSLPTHNYNTRTPHPQYVDDDIFFSRERVKLGTRFINVGQRERGSTWVVNSILSPFIVKGGYEVRPVQQVRYLSDVVVLQHVHDRKMFRRTTYGTMKYSAVWRILP